VVWYLKVNLEHNVQVSACGRNFMANPGAKLLNKSWQVQSEPTHYIRFLEELSMNALPALQTIYYDGWVLRFAGGYTRRANSIYALYEPKLNMDVESKIWQCERRYGERKQPVVFKMTPMVCPQDLDSILEAADYRQETGASVQTMPLGNIARPADANIKLSTTLSDDWLRAFFRLNAVPDRYFSVMKHMLNSIIPLKCCATLYYDNQIAALGLGVVDQGHIGLFDIVTAPEFRRRGLARQLVSHLLYWGQFNAARQAYLQVVPTNLPALNLYAELGFQEVYQYRYRVKW
jgi:GNAT superfamily N-acetyltransferase